MDRAGCHGNADVIQWPLPLCQWNELINTWILACGECNHFTCGVTWPRCDALICQLGEGKPPFIHPPHPSVRLRNGNNNNIRDWLFFFFFFLFTRKKRLVRPESRPKQQVPVFESVQREKNPSKIPQWWRIAQRSTKSTSESLKNGRNRYQNSRSQFMSLFRGKNPSKIPQKSLNDEGWHQDRRN